MGLPHDSLSPVFEKGAGERPTGESVIPGLATSVLAATHTSLTLLASPMVLGQVTCQGPSEVNTF